MNLDPRGPNLHAPVFMKKVHGSWRRRLLLLHFSLLVVHLTLTITIITTSITLLLSLLLLLLLSLLSITIIKKVPTAAAATNDARRTARARHVAADPWHGASHA